MTFGVHPKLTAVHADWAVRPASISELDLPIRFWAVIPRQSVRGHLARRDLAQQV